MLDDVKEKKNVKSNEHDSGFIEADNLPLSALVANICHTDSDDIPLGVLCEQNRGRPCQHRKCMEYTESSLDSASDSDLEQTSRKQRKPYVPVTGPSRLCMQAVRNITTKSGAVGKEVCMQTL